ncbi:MAG: ketoacyl-ACP synthase III [Salinivirgaceae bacterium]|jgi:3-oxoacyl-[acyl-carrier-protein] synthase-3|nr:ketoacyl-ACP synthase III [Salinivirgaceae bacterium]
MFINALGHYLPEELVPNEYFLNVNGLTEEWIYTRTGIKTRTKAAEYENTNTMSIEAVKNAMINLPYDISEVDLIIGASYSPYDSVATIAHVVQKEFNIDNAKSLYVSSACSSFINAVEITQGYFAMNKASKVLIVASEHNTAYSDESDEKSGHLWGDGAAAIFISKDPINENEGEIIDVYTRGLGHIGKSTEAVYLHLAHDGLVMPNGKDVFTHACKYMIEALSEIVKRNDTDLNKLDYIIPHQANMRIINYIAQELDFDLEKIITNIQDLGNTGCASTLIGLSQNIEKMKPGHLVGFTVFGGGYSSGSMLVQF